MQKQKLQQKQQLNISVEQIQFLNLLQIPAINWEQRIREELEDNPTLEEELVDDEIEEKSESGYSKNTYSLKSKENKTEKIKTKRFFLPKCSFLIIHFLFYNKYTTLLLFGEAKISKKMAELFI